MTQLQNIITQTKSDNFSPKFGSYIKSGDAEFLKAIGGHNLWIIFWSYQTTDDVAEVFK